MHEQSTLQDKDPQETREWLDSMESVIEVEGRPRAHYLIDQLLDFDVARHGDFHGRVTTPYVNSIAPERELPYPGDLGIERRLNAFKPMPLNWLGPERFGDSNIWGYDEESMNVVRHQAGSLPVFIADSAKAA